MGASESRGGDDWFWTDEDDDEGENWGFTCNDSDVSCDGSNASSDDFSNPCCNINEVASNVSRISQLITFLRPSFDTEEIQNVMKSIGRDHFIYNTGVKIQSVFYNKGDEPTYDNGFHVCFAPRREVNIETVTAQIMETLQFRPGHSFLNLGSGTGFISTLAGLLIGASGVNHGIEINPEMLTYAEERQRALRDHVLALQDYEYCEPNFVLGDCLKLDPTPTYYDRIFCGCILPPGFEDVLKKFLKEGGILMHPLETSDFAIITRAVENGEVVFNRQEEGSFSALHTYPFVTDDSDTVTELPDKKFPSLQQLTRAVIRTQIRKVMNNIQAPDKKRKSEDENEALSSDDDCATKTNKKMKSSESEDDNDNEEEEEEENADSVQVEHRSEPSVISNISHSSLPSSQHEFHEIDFRTIQNYDFKVRPTNSSTATEINSQDNTTTENNVDVDNCSINETHKSDEVGSAVEEEVAEEEVEEDEENVVNNGFIDYIPGVRAAGESSSDDSDIIGDESSVDTEIYDDSDDDDLLHISPEHQYCGQCYIIKSKSVPRRVVKHNPIEYCTANSFHGRINTLQLPDNILLYLKYKHNLITE